MKRDFILWELPVAEAHVLYAWARTNDGMASLSIVGDGYIAMEAERRLGGGR